jgi:hypothetical protein
MTGKKIKISDYVLPSIGSAYSGVNTIAILILLVVIKNAVSRLTPINQIKTEQALTKKIY